MNARGSFASYRRDDRAGNQKSDANAKVISGCPVVGVDTFRSSEIEHIDGRQRREAEGGFHEKPSVWSWVEVAKISNNIL